MHKFQERAGCCLGGLGDDVPIKWYQSIVTALDKGLTKGSHDQVPGLDKSIKRYDEAAIPVKCFLSVIVLFTKCATD